MSEVLKLQQGIKNVEGDLVNLAKKLVKETQVHNKLEENSMRNLLQVAIDAKHLSVVTCFIEYQIGRDKDKWSKFGEELKTTLETGIATYVNTVKKEARDSSEAEVKMRLARLLIGFINWQFYYKKKA